MQLGSGQHGDSVAADDRDRKILRECIFTAVQCLYVR